MEIAYIDLKSSADRIGDRSMKTAHNKMSLIKICLWIMAIGIVVAPIVAYLLASAPAKSHQEIRSNTFASLQTVKGYSIVVTQN